jgi:hypothetical protein
VILHSISSVTNICFSIFGEKSFEVKKSKYYQAKNCQEYVMFENGLAIFTSWENENAQA